MMMQPPYESLPPASKAIADFRHGGGQDTNPYNKAAQPDEWEAYARTISDINFKIEQRQLNQVINEVNGKWQKM